MSNIIPVGPVHNDPVIKQAVHGNETYSVNVVRMPDMTFDTYGIINRETGVIEQIQPNLYNAKYIADQFDKWLRVGPSSEDEVDALLRSMMDPSSSGRAN